MATYIKSDVQLSYDTVGSGFPILLIAPGGLRSERAMWRNSPLEPVATLSKHFQVVAMDQRNAGTSTGPIEPDHGWATYTQDQLDLMTHLGHQRFGVVGMCIGGPYILNLVKTAPQRIAACAIMQTIGRENNHQEFLHMFDGWASQLNQQNAERFPQTALLNQRRRMFENNLTFMCMEETEIQKLKTPMLILDGADTYHPASSSQRLAELQPHALRLREWKTPPHLAQAESSFVSFFQQHLGSHS